MILILKWIQKYVLWFSWKFIKSKLKAHLGAVAAQELLFVNSLFVNCLWYLINNRRFKLLMRNVALDINSRSEVDSLCKLICHNLLLWRLGELNDLLADSSSVSFRTWSSISTIPGNSSYKKLTFSMIDFNKTDIQHIYYLLKQR